MSQDRPIYNDGVTPTSLEAFNNRRCGLPYSHAQYRPPSPEEVAALIQLTGWSQTKTAQLTGVSYDPKKGSSTVRKWKTHKGRKEYREIPYAAWRLLLLYAGVVSLDDGLGAIDAAKAKNPA